MSGLPLARELVKHEFVRYTRGNVLDVGHGPVKAFRQWVGVRAKDDAEMGEVKADITVAALDRLDSFEDGASDAIVAADVMRLVAADFTLDDWLRCLRVGGHLCIYEPTETHRVRLINLYCNAGGLDVVRLEDWEGGGWLVVLRKRGDRKPTDTAIEQRVPNSVIVVRHGGFGDQLQAACLFPALKREGMHITMLTTPKGRDIIEHDPHVDDWFMVDRDQVPNGELAHFWQVVGRHYDRLINLNESVEGTFLAIPQRPNHAWPQPLRHVMMNRNYGQFAADLAQVPFVPEGRFYASEQEKEWAFDLITGINAEVNKTVQAPYGVATQESTFMIMWALSGSSPHKFTPHQDTVIQMVINRLKRAVVILVGDEACKILEAGLEHPRIRAMSGELTIRQTLALAQSMNLVIGPETGVLNSVAFNEHVAKVVLLSHSSQENLTKHWRQTHTVNGVAPCFPCHQIHHTSEFCPTSAETGAAMCQQGVNPGAIYSPIDFEYVGWVKVHALRGAA